MEDAIELVFIPASGMGHLVSAVGTAKLLLQARPQLSVTVLIMKLPFAPDSNINSYIDSLLADDDDKDNSRLKLIPLPDALKGHTDMASIFRVFLDSQKTKVRECVNEMLASVGVRQRLAGFVVDMILCSTMMDVADEFGVPTYVFYPSGAAMLGLHLHLQSLNDDHALEFKDSDPHLNISTYSKPFPLNLLPYFLLDNTNGCLDGARRIRRAKGVIVNTFFDLERHRRHALESLSKDRCVPPVYPVGPILNLNSHYNKNRGSLMKWLDDQPVSSVVFLCFGSGGTFPETQVKEIAYALESSGQRFLWALRKPPCPGSLVPTEYTNPEEVLPEGFLERTQNIGKIIGWAPQSEVLAHPSVGGFMSHCGWNSILESIWFGIPMATWPMCADQHGNAFQLVREIGMAVEVTMDYKIDSKDPKTNFLIVPEIVNAKEIEFGITSLMDHSTSNSIRTKANNGGWWLIL
ncbi:anthocyanidin 3-O-glucosyltransferase 2-like [Ipomoea triloba]|uniref:anthocyanidin 3-O-glucosyltransferase 2-like n=1 Tax=Ipomoea triloba TaxID=35885 RepID=UPI00125D03A3|nr:anthocyanidin 3-O-glucosyltransferase 2-like [Ipomoea triloba]